MRGKAGRKGSGAARLFLLGAIVAFAAAGGRAEGNALFDAAFAIAGNNCAECHDWAKTPAGLLSVVVPGDPGASRLMKAVANDSMPLGAEPLSAEDKAALEAWIQAGAPLPAGASTAAPSALPSPASRRSPVPIHRITGFAAAGLLFAAGAVGTWRLVDLIGKGHAYRDSIGFNEDNPSAAELQAQQAEIARLWADPSGQGLRWTHLALLASGGALYLYNAVTGIGMLTPKDPTLTKRDLHRWGFYLHLGLMAGEATLGILTSEALKKGDHELVSTLAPIHAFLGAATPLTILGSGLIFSLKL